MPATGWAEPAGLINKSHASGFFPAGSTDRAAEGCDAACPLPVTINPRKAEILGG